MGDKKGKAAKRKNNGTGFLLRGGFMVLAFVVVAAMLGFRLAQIQVVDYSDWSGKAARQQMASSEIAPQRGTIYDAEGNILAQSVTVWTIEASPDVLAQSKLAEPYKTTTTPARLASEQLAELLGVDYDTLYANLSDADKKYYKIRGQVEKPLTDEVKAVMAEYGIKGIYFTEDSKREYPYGDLAATVLGFVNDAGGAEGLENFYNKQLTGTAGRSDGIVNAVGGDMPSGGDEMIYDPIDGLSLHTTINIEIQQIAEKYLAAGVDYYRAEERGMVIVMDVNTFEILAMATSPAFDPNDAYYIYDDATRAAIEEMPAGTDDEKTARSAAQGSARILQWRNKAVADTYEPGSVMKIITAAAALDSGMYSIGSMLYCGGNIPVPGIEKGMSCANGAVHGQLTLGEALIHSCNVSFIQVGWNLGTNTWYDYINAFGFTEPTGIDLPGEPNQAAVDRLVYSPDRMNDAELASVSFGQSNKYTPVQMIAAVSAAINGGYLGTPHLVNKLTDAEGNVVQTIEPDIKRQVISNETSALLREVLEDLVTNYTGNHAYVAGYRVAGKSGTSNKLDKLDEYGNVQSVYISSFLGFAPANDPQIAVLYVLDEPDDWDFPTTRNWFGSRLAGPYVGNIIAEIMPILGIDPDYKNNEELLRSTINTPSLTGQAPAKAQVSLNQAGLGYIVVGTGGTVTGQFPAHGQKVPYGGQVILYTDDAAEQNAEPLPDFTGQKPEAAKATLRGMGLNVLTEGPPDSGEDTYVAAQSYEPGSVLPKGTTVVLTMADRSDAGEW